MSSKVITALFDIGREKYDGRNINDYLSWFEKTLQLNCEFVIFTEPKFEEFVRLHRSDATIIIQELDSVPYFQINDRINTIINSPEYQSKMADTSRIECRLSLYNVIQYSKFGWLQKAIELFPEVNQFFWMDAGCSRFFEDVDISIPWPATNGILDEKVVIQSNINFPRIFPKLDRQYIWSNESILVGTLFGGCSNKLLKLISDIELFIKDMLDNNEINNEQFALAFMAKNNPNDFYIYSELNGTHLPLFKFLAKKNEV